MSMDRIIEMTEVDQISGNDYVHLQSPTLGDRRIKASNLGGGGGGGNSGITMSEFYFKEFNEYTNNNRIVSLEPSKFNTEWYGNPQIGHSLNGTAKLKGFDKLKFSIDYVGEGYQHTNSNHTRNFNIAIVVTDIKVDTYINLDNLETNGHILAIKEYDGNDVYGQSISDEIDLSNISGDYYINYQIPGINLIGFHAELTLDGSVAENYAWASVAMGNAENAIAVRIKLSDSSWRVYFNGGYNYSSSSFAQVPIPIKPFAAINVGARCYVDGNPSNEAVVGFYDNTIRIWYPDLSGNRGGRPYGIIESTDVGISYDNYHVWEEPSFDPYNG